MSFTGRQQPELREYLALAWNAHCTGLGVVAEAVKCLRGKRCRACAFCTWYEDTLEAATGNRSTTDCNAWRDYDYFMRELELIHRQAIKWQMKAANGDVRRLLHGVCEIAAGRQFGEPFLRGLAMKALKLSAWPGWERLDERQIGIVAEGLKAHARHLRDCEAPEALALATPGDDAPEIDIPF